jgi:glycosyltransferase involved in cell wall biosynthesis
MNFLSSFRKRISYWSFLSSAPIFSSKNLRKNSSDLLLLTIAFNESSLIEDQIVLLKKFVTDPFDHVVVDNSTDLSVRQTIKEICQTYGVGYAGVPIPNPFQKNKSHAAAMHWAYFQLVRKSKAKVIGFLDHDVFPLKPYSILHKVKNGIYGRVMHTYFPSGYLEELIPESPYWSLWAGFCFFEKRLLKGPFPWSFNFFSKYFPGGYFLDTGGGLWDKVFSKLDYPGPMASYEIRKISDQGEGIQNQSLELIDGSWIHFVSLSNWREIKDLKGKKEKLTEILSKAKNEGLDITNKPL